MNSNPSLFETQSASFLQQNAAEIFPRHLIGQPGVYVIRQTLEPGKLESMWLNKKDLAIAFQHGEGHVIQHHIAGLMGAVVRTNFEQEICMGVLSDDLEQIAICMLSPDAKGPKRRRPKGFGRTPRRFSPDGPSAA